MKERKNRHAKGRVVGTAVTNNCTYWIFPTGKFINSLGENTEKKHIFDMGGNVWEWTTELCFTNGRNLCCKGWMCQ